MKLTKKGIGWLIFGALVIMSSTEAYGVRETVSTIALGLVFVAVYFMKQFFKPRWYGLFILAGVLLAYCVEADSASDMVYPLLIAVVLMGVFYYLNKVGVDDMIDGIDSVDDDELENFDYVDPETYEEPARESAGDSSESQDDADGAVEIEAEIPAPKGKPEGSAKKKADVVEFEFETKDTTKK